MRKEKAVWILIFLFASFIYFPTAVRPIRDAESKYVEIPREFFVSGDWLSPKLDFVNYYTKPPFSFWITAIGYKIFGISPSVARSINIIWAFLCSLLLGIFAEELFGRWIGPITSAIFLLISEVFAYCLDAGIEFSLIFFIISSILFFWKYWEKGKKVYLLFFYLSMGLGYMTKGLLGFCIPSAVIFFFLLFTKKLHKLFEIIYLPGITLFLVLVLPWTLIMSLKDPDFFSYFIINEHIGRITGQRDTKEAIFPTSSFLAHVAGEFFPWIMYIHIIAKRLFFGIKEKEEKFILLFVWSAIPLLLFSISKNKVDFYGLHVYPGLTVVLSYEIKRLFEKRENLGLWAYPWIFVFILSAISFFIIGIKPDLFDIPSVSVARFFLLISSFFGLFIFILLKKGRLKLSSFLISLYMLLFFLCTERMYIADFDNDSMKFATDVLKKVKKDYPIFCSNLPEFSHVAIVNFYTGKKVYILRGKENLPGYEERRRLYIDDKDFLRILEEKGKAFIIGDTEDVKERLRRLGLRYKILCSSSNRSLFLVQK